MLSLWAAGDGFAMPALTPLAQQHRPPNCPLSCVVQSQPGTHCCSFCKKHWLKVKCLAGLSKAEAWTWNCAVGTVCASTLWWFYFSLDGEQQHTRTKGKLGRELPSEWPFSPLAGGGGKPLPLIGSRTQVSKWQNSVWSKGGGILGLCEEKEIILKKALFLRSSSSSVCAEKVWALWLVLGWVGSYWK